MGTNSSVPMPVILFLLALLVFFTFLWSLLLPFSGSYDESIPSTFCHFALAESSLP